MRDYRDAKAMAQAVRAFLSDHGVKITNSQSLELMAKAFGFADWNTLTAAISGEVSPPRTKAATHQPQLMPGSDLGSLGFLPNLNSLYSVPSATLMRENTSTRR